MGAALPAIASVHCRGLHRALTWRQGARRHADDHKVTDKAPYHCKPLIVLSKQTAILGPMVHTLICLHMHPDASS
jgi:hypothetical protein